MLPTGPPLNLDRVLQVLGRISIKKPITISPSLQLTMGEETFTIPPPFDADSPGDCYLKTVDGDSFKVFKNILSLASPVFRDMFTLPQHDESQEKCSAANLPVISLTEDTSTIHHALLLLYPPGEIEPPRIDFDLFVKLVAAHEKYDMSQNRLRGIARELWRSEDTLSANGIQMYAVAWRLRLEDEAKVASRYTHTVDLDHPKIFQDVIEHSGSVLALITLMALRRSREQALDAVLATCDLRRSLCSMHGGQNANQSEGDYWSKVSLLKSKLRAALLAPYPICKGAFTFLGIASWSDQATIPSGFMYNVPRCGERDCRAQPSLELTTNLARAVSNYPQEIPGFATG